VFDWTPARDIEMMDKNGIRTAVHAKNFEDLVKIQTEFAIQQIRIMTI
jgi:hypothetical protein